jgi:ribosomal protein S18 acetylase RimI-like enzyme
VNVVHLERLLERTKEIDAEVGRVMDRCGDYYHAVHGRPANGTDLHEFFHVEVPGIAPEDVHCYLLKVNGEVVGIAGMILGWKRPGQSMIGLLAVADRFRSKGYGRDAVAELERVARATPHGESLRIGIVETNVPAFGFWHSLGFRETGERRSIEGFRGDVVLLEKSL